MGRTEEAVVVEGLRRRVEELEAENAGLKERLQRLGEGSRSHVRALVEAGRVAVARGVVKMLTELIPLPALEGWAKALAPTMVRSGGKATGCSASFARNYEWLREHDEEYSGQWVALRDGALLGSDPDRVTLHRRLEQAGSLEGALFTLV